MAVRAEQETIITMVAGEASANIYTCDPAWKAKLEKLNKKVRECGHGVEVTVPKQWIKIVPPAKKGKKK